MIRSLLLILLLPLSPLMGWWDMGHMAVAQIASETLYPEVREKVECYLSSVTPPFPAYDSMVMASVWADDIYHQGIQAFFHWHISPRPYDPKGVLSKERYEQLLASIEERDVVWIINEAKKTLSDPNATPWAKGFMLLFLIHMVGDVHQPLHCITLYNKEFPNGDKGGNSFSLKSQHYPSLHKLFDAAFGLCDLRPERPMNCDDAYFLSELVCYLKCAFPISDFEIDGSENPDNWRQESYELGAHFAYSNFKPMTSPSSELMEEGRIITGRRLALAGYRLGALLNSILK